MKWSHFMWKIRWRRFLCILYLIHLDHFVPVPSFLSHQTLCVRDCEFRFNRFNTK